MAKHLIKSDLTIRNAKSTDTTVRLSDGEGLYLLVMPNGSRRWRLDYTISSKRKTISIGVYPSVGLSDARVKANEARKLVAEGIDPSDIRKAKKAEVTRQNEDGARISAGLPAIGSFEEVAREWFVKYSTGWAISHANKIIRRLERDIFPYIGDRPIARVIPPANKGI